MKFIHMLLSVRACILHGGDHLHFVALFPSPAVGPEDKDLCYSSGPGTSWTQGGFCPNDADIVRTGAKSFCGMTTVAIRQKLISLYDIDIAISIPQEGIYYVINPSKEIPWTGVNELGQVGSCELHQHTKMLSVFTLTNA
jgi:hypothetical protein